MQFKLSNAVGYYKTRKRQKKVVALLLSLVFAIAAILTISLRSLVVEGKLGVIPQSTLTVQDKLLDLLGSAKPYGLFTNEFYQGNDFQSNFAANTYYVEEQSIGSDLSSSMGTIYFKKMIATNKGNVMQLKANAADNIVVGMPFDQDESQNLIKFKNTDLSINYANCKSTKFYYDEDQDYLNISAGLNYIGKNADWYAKRPDSAGIEWDRKDANDITLDIRNCTDPICTVTITSDEYELYQLGKLDIIKNENQMIMINVNVLANQSQFNLTRYNINHKSSTSSGYESLSGKEKYLDFISNADTILWNFNQYGGTINMSEVCGIVIAPFANVNIVGTCTGRVICNVFNNPDGELHFISQDVPFETQTDTSPVTETTTETPKETETTTETPKETETTTETPTETPKETETTTETPKETETTTETPKETETTTETPKETETTTETPKETETTTESPKETETTTETPKETETTTETPKEIETTTESPKETETTTQSPSITEMTTTIEQIETGSTDPSLTKVESTTNNENVVITGNNGPKTGDGIYLAIYIIIMISAVGLFAGVGMYKLYQQKSKKKL